MGTLEWMGLKTRDTVLCDTFAAFATSRMVTACGRFGVLVSSIYSIFYEIVCGVYHDSNKISKKYNEF